jgi:hypothetical protein
LGASDLPAPLFPMHRREALARGEGSRTDTMHVIVTSVNSVLILLAIGFGSTAFGKRFRLYSSATILVLVVTGGLTATQASRLEAKRPTPVGRADRAHQHRRLPALAGGAGHRSLAHASERSAPAVGLVVRADGACSPARSCARAHGGLDD